MFARGRELAHFILACALALAVLGGCAEAAQEKPRVALVIGIGKYLHVPALPNPPNDAREVAAALGRVGFDVDFVADPDKPTLDAAIRRFGERASGADAALFYYAGHALELEGRNWIVPASANIRSARDLPYETTDIDTLMAQLEGAARLTIVVLDACRENPFRQKLSNGRGLESAPGLAEIRAATGALIEYATAPGMVAADGSGQHSPFTEALLRHIETPGLEVHQLFGAVRRDVRSATNNRQIPWESSAMEGEFYFHFVTPSPPQSLPAAGETAEMLFWKSIAESRDPQDFKAYLTKFPDGVYAGLATNRLRQLGQSAPPQPEPTRKAEAEAIMSDDDLRQRIYAAAPSLSAGAKDNVRLYLGMIDHRALFLSPKRTETYRVGPYSSPLVAEEAGAERCQLHFGGPCSLLSADRRPPDPAAGLRDMARIAYTGRFDPEQVPGLTPGQRAGDYLTSYASAKGPKAIALHNWGRTYEITGVPDQPTAESQALDACNDDPDRRGRDGPCFLYAVGDKVVLPERRQDPTDAEARYARISEAAAQVLSANSLKAMTAEYLRASEPKALAISLAGGRYFASWGRFGGSREDHETLALEGCQQTYGSPCVLLATGTELHTADPATAPARDMPRLHYSGAFSPASVPFVRADKATDLAGYASLPEHKAIAIRAVWTRYSIISSAASAAEAERQALAKCKDADPDVKYPCFVYASGMQVVLPERRTEAKH